MPAWLCTANPSFWRDRNRTRSAGSAGTQLHELSHQWFGDLVTMKWWDDIWLNEAFATWMEEKLIAEWKPGWKSRVEYVSAKLYAEKQDSLITARKIRQPIESKGDIDSAFDAITYQKGAAVIGMFESWMGPRLFRAGIQKYLRQHSFQNATSGDFLDTLASTGNKEVVAAFSTFLDQPGVPLVSMAVSCGDASTTLRLEQSRFLPLGSRGSAAQVWRIPVCVRYPAGTAVRSECTLMTRPRMEWPLKGAQGCPAWVEGDDNARGYYRVNYQDGLLASLSAGDVVARLNASERADLIGNVEAMAESGKLPGSDALGLVQAFHSDPDQNVVQGALDMALWPRKHLVPPDLLPNYERFILRNFQTRARELSWAPRPGEADDARLLRPSLASAVATFGGDQALRRTAQELTDRWFSERTAVSPDLTSAVLGTAAYSGGVGLFNRFLAAFQKTEDRQEKQALLEAMKSFRDRAAVEAAMRAVLSGSIKLVDGLPLLLQAGQNSPQTREAPFEFVKAHFDEIVKGRPSIFGSDLGSFLPRVGASFCDTRSREDLRTFFGPRADQYPGATVTFAQVLEGIDLCIAARASQESSVRAFLKEY
jgi:aminopeptidase N